MLITMLSSATRRVKEGQNVSLRPFNLFQTKLQHLDFAPSRSRNPRILNSFHTLEISVSPTHSFHTFYSLFEKQWGCTLSFPKRNHSLSPAASLRHPIPKKKEFFHVRYSRMPQLPPE